MSADPKVFTISRFDELAHLLSKITDRSNTAQEVDRLTDRISELMWSVSGPDPQAEPVMEKFIRDSIRFHSQKL